jgi:hypothetical protein
MPKNSFNLLIYTKYYQEILFPFSLIDIVNLK